MGTKFDIPGGDVFDADQNGSRFTVPRYGGIPRYLPTFNVDYDRSFLASPAGVLGSTVEVGDWSSVSGLHQIVNTFGVRPNTAVFNSRWTVANTTIVPQLDPSKPWWLYAAGDWAGGDFIRFMLLFGDDNSAGTNQRLWGLDSSSGTMKYTKIQGNGSGSTNFGTADPVPGPFTMELRKFGVGSAGPAAPISFCVNGAVVQQFTSDVFAGSPITARWGFSLEENAAPLNNVTMSRWRMRGNT